MSEPGVPDPLTDEEFERFRQLLRRYCAWSLDQWSRWRTATPYGPVYISISRKIQDGVSAEAHDSID
jgi:hypothetical protein